MAGEARLLLVDESAVERAVLKDFLASNGYEVLEASDGEEALRQAKSFGPDLILLDIALPNGIGVEVLRALRGDNGTLEIPIIAIAAEEGGVVQGFEAVADDYVTRPVRRPELLTRVRTQLRGKYLQEQLEKEKRDLSAILEIAKAISSTLKPEEILSVIVRMAATILGALRCSLILVGHDGKHGYVLASHENPDLPRVKIPLRRYPEVREAIKARRTVIVWDTASDPLMAGVRARLLDKDFASILVLPIVLEDDVVGTILLRMARSQRTFTEREVRLCEIVAELAAKALQNAHLFQDLELENLHLEKLSLIDDLTDAYNRRFLFKSLDEEFKRAERSRQPLSCIMLDIDHFKQVNDSCGHDQGDRVLKELSALIMARIRRTDLLARYGGEEFVILLPSTDGEGAYAEAERLRLAVKAYPFSGSGSFLPLTVSQGVATYPHERVKSGHDLLVEADNALYLAKGSGRDAVVAAWLSSP